MTDYRHRCTTAECPYLGQLTDNLSCGCHRKEAEIMREKLALLTRDTIIITLKEHINCEPWSNVGCDLVGIEDAADAILKLLEIPNGTLEKA